MPFREPHPVSTESPIHSRRYAGFFGVEPKPAAERHRGGDRATNQMTTTPKYEPDRRTEGHLPPVLRTIFFRVA
jgi:hypothetical protein